MDIAALSMALANQKVQQQASVSIMKKVMDMAEVQTQGIVDMMEETALPASFGHQLDISV